MPNKQEVSSKMPTFEQIKNKEQLKSFVRRTAALAFVPIHFVHLAWQGIKADTPELL